MTNWVKTLKTTLFSVLIFLTACEPSLPDLAQTQQPDKFVIWCALHPDSVAKAYVSKTAPPFALNDSARLVSDAQVVLFENDRPADTLFYVEKNIYQSRKSFKPTEKNTYKIRASRTGLPTAETVADTMLTKPKVLKLTPFFTPVDKGVVVSVEVQTDFPKHGIQYFFDERNFPNERDSFILVPPQFALRISECIEEGSACPFTPTDRYVLTDGQNYCTDSCRSTFRVNAKILTITAHGIRVQSLIQQYISDSGIDNAFSSGYDFLFTAPVFSPEFVKNGFGGLYCTNSTNILFDFKGRFRTNLDLRFTIYDLRFWIYY
ncbi:MAG: DUF4249 family protein [Saprospiraceae bacterium]|nr:DUF4249 family protein [Saprospiraceae bacterium]